MTVRAADWPLACLVAVILSSQVSAEFYTFLEWQRLHLSDRVSYISGALDAAVGLTADHINLHYKNCVSRLGMTNKQLADNVLTFGQNLPEMHGVSAALVMGVYLARVCGQPTSPG